MCKTVFYDEDEKIFLTRFWSSKDGKLILDIHSVGAGEYPEIWFAYNELSPAPGEEK